MEGKPREEITGQSADARTKNISGGRSRLRPSVKIALAVLVVWVCVLVLLVLCDASSSSRELERQLTRARQKGLPTSPDRGTPVRKPTAAATALLVHCAELDQQLEITDAYFLEGGDHGTPIPVLYSAEPDRLANLADTIYAKVPDIREALSEKPFHYGHGDYVTDSVDDIMALRQACRLVCLAGQVRLEQGRIDDAVEGVVLINRVAETFQGKPGLLDGLVQCGLFGFGWKLAVRVAAHEKVDTTILQRLATSYVRCSESYCFRPHIEGMIAHVANVQWTQALTSSNIHLDGIHEFLYTHYAPIRRRDRAACLGIYLDTYDRVDTPRMVKQALVGQRWDANLPWMSALAASQVKPCSNILFSVGLVRARLRTAAVALSIASEVMRGNTIDASCEKLSKGLCVDPFGGKPLKVMRRGDWLVVYSIGSDLVDNGGQPEDGSQYEELPGEDLVFRVRLAKKPEQPEDGGP